MRVGMNADHAIFFVDQIAYGYSAFELEVGNFEASATIISSIAGCGTIRGRTREPSSGKVVTPPVRRGTSRAVPIGMFRQGVELLTKSGLVHRRDSRRHQHFAAKLAGEISLPFEQGDRNAAAGEHVGEQGARGPCADDDCAGIADFARDRSSINVARPSR